MKQFLYLNTDMINSIIAQEHNGLIQKYIKDVENTKSKSVSDSVNNKISMGGNIGIKKLVEVEASFESELADSTKHGHQRVVSKVYEKTLHDASFDIAVDIIKPIDLPFGKEADLGDYVTMGRIYDFIDIDLLKRLFSKDGFADCLVKQREQDVKKEIQEKTNRAQRRENENRIKQFIIEKNNDIKAQYDSIEVMINALSELLPFDRLLFAGDGYIIPVEEAYFRVNPKGLGLSYSGELKVVGIVTNVIGADTKPSEPNNLFENIQYGINELIRGLLPTKDDNLYVVTPIAVYYE